MRRAQREANFDDDAGRREECLRNRSEKEHLRELRARPLPRAAGNTVGPKPAKALPGEAPLSITVSWMESQNGNPGLILPSQGMGLSYFRKIPRFHARSSGKSREMLLSEHWHQRALRNCCRIELDKVRRFARV